MMWHIHTPTHNVIIIQIMCYLKHMAN